jgi:16S rRNA (adenine1518-N6/adenine1519-N6)-dimethyltransferase
MKLSKSLGQVFLKDNNYISRILDSLDIEGEDVLEIGAGDGRMSELIADKAKFLYCLEVDGRLYRLLTKKFAGSSRLEVIHKDILKFPLSALNKQLVIFGNVPYQISNYIIRYLVDNRTFIKRAYLTFQKEFVHKLVAQPSTKAYGALSCYLQFYAKAQKVFDIPARAFSPVPKIDSSFMKIEFYAQSPYSVKDPEHLFKIIRRAFSQRRKKIVNSLPALKGKQDLLVSLGIPFDARAENVSLVQYAALANKLG